MVPAPEKLLEILSPETETAKFANLSRTFEGTAQSHFFPLQNFRGRCDLWHALHRKEKLLMKVLPVVSAPAPRQARGDAKQNEIERMWTNIYQAPSHLAPIERQYLHIELL